MKTAKRTIKEPKRPISSDTDMGNTIEVADYMRVSRWWLQCVKKCARARAEKDPTNRVPWIGGLTSKSYIMAWLERNPDFVATHQYQRKKSQQGTPSGRQPAGADKRGGSLRGRGRQNASPAKSERQLAPTA